MHESDSHPTNSLPNREQLLKDRKRKLHKTDLVGDSGFRILVSGLELLAFPKSQIPDQFRRY